jgi:hypothetical protein
MTVSIKTCTSCGYDGWLRPEICTKVYRLHIEQTNSAIAYMIDARNCSRAPTFGTGFFCISSQNHFIRILSFLYLRNRMEWSAWRAWRPMETRRTHFYFVLLFAYFFCSHVHVSIKPEICSVFYDKMYLKLCLFLLFLML